jgi:small-conductance mechanosensitive channel
MPERITIFSRQWFIDSGPRILVILAIALLLVWLSRLLVRRMQRKLEGVESVTQEYDLRRSYTLTHALSYALRVVVWTVTLLLLLGQFGISLAPLIAGAGIVGVALGFGAQSLVRDFLSGFFILLENQYAVGESVAVSAVGGVVEGRVESLTLRATSVRAGDGTLHVFANGNVLLVANRSRGTGSFSVEVRLPAGADLDEARRTLDSLFDEMHGQSPLASRPRIAEVRTITPGHRLLRIEAETRPSRRQELEAELRKRISVRLLPTRVEADLSGVT